MSIVTWHSILVNCLLFIRINPRPKRSFFAMTFQEKIRNAGVVGCGGAGFPAHVKAASTVEYVLANGAECEPLLHKDLELLMREPDAVVKGMVQLMSSTGAKKGILGIKKKYEE